MKIIIKKTILILFIIEVLGCVAIAASAQTAKDSTATAKLTKSVQCSAISKSTGERCKRQTKNADGKCTQHQQVEARKAKK